MARLARIICAYLVASLIAGLTLSLPVVLSSSNTSARAAAAVSIVGFVALVALPAIPAIVYAEKRSERRFGFYAASGVLVALVLPVILALFAGISFVLLLASALLGLVAGSIYWLVAGRHAGRIEENQRAS